MVFWSLRVGRSAESKTQNNGRVGREQRQLRKQHRWKTRSTKKHWWKPTSMFNTRRSQTASGKGLLPSGFSSAEPGKPAHLVQLILRAGDVEVNPGPKRVVCPVCCNTINDKRETSVWCHLGGWVHLKCTPLKSEKDHSIEFVCSRCSWCKTSPDLTCPTEGQHGRGRGHHAARARTRDDRCEASPDLTCPTEGQHGRGGEHRTVRMSSKCRTDERWRKRKEQKRERGGKEDKS